MGIIFKQQTAVSEKASANPMFLGRTLDYIAERLEESLWKILLREGRLLTGLMKSVKS